MQLLNKQDKTSYTIKSLNHSFIDLIPIENRFYNNTYDLSRDELNDLSQQINKENKANKQVFYPEGDLKNKEDEEFLKTNKDKQFIVLGIMRSCYNIFENNKTVKDDYYTILEYEIILINADLNSNKTLKNNLFLISVPYLIEGSSKSKSEISIKTNTTDNLNNLFNKNFYCWYKYNLNSFDLTISDKHYSIIFSFPSNYSATIGHTVDVNLNQIDNSNVFERAKVISSIIKKYTSSNLSTQELSLLNAVNQNTKNLIKHEIFDPILSAHDKEDFYKILPKINKDIRNLSLEKLTNKWAIKSKTEIPQQIKKFQESERLKQEIKERKERQKKEQAEKKERQSYLNELQQK